MDEYKRKSQWLARYRAAVQRQQLLAQELAQLRAEAEHLGGAAGAPVGGPPSPDRDRLPRAVERITAAEQALEAQIAACLACRAEVVSAIATVAHPQQQEVLRRRYLLGQTYAEMADAMALVERRVYQLHRAALANMTGICNQVTETAGDTAQFQTEFCNTAL